jgi:tetratricopeptide (TPR) repeat protein
MGLFFSKKKQIAPDAIVEEKWKTSFGWLDKKRFIQEEKSTYSSKIIKNSYKNVLSLQLKKIDHFAWITSSLYRYRNFVIEADTSFNLENGHSALGFILRYINDDNFYYFLISNAGFFRFDVIFNKNPLVLIDWTENQEISREKNRIRIITHDNHFSFFIKDEWIGEVDDETLHEGKMGFAAQNFSDKPSASFHLERFQIDSRPLEVEKAYFLWVKNNIIKPDSRISLARSFFNSGQFQAVIVQLKKALKGRELSSEEYFLLAEAFIKVNMFESALNCIEKVIELDPKMRNALHEKANLLYILNKLPEAKEQFENILPLFKESPAIWNKLGNVEHALGHYKKALNAYKKAIQLEPEVPLYKMNAAKTLEILGNENEALRVYLEAATLFFKEEAYNDLTTILARVKRIQPDNMDVLALEAKILFHEERKEEAKLIFRYLFNKGYQESSVFYLYGLILSEEGEREEALSFYKKACSLEPDFAIYWFRLAENMYILGKNPEKEISKALKLAPDYPWINNLKGLLLLKEGKKDKASIYLVKAYNKAPVEVDICINYTECLAQLNQVNKAMEIIKKILASNPDNPKLLNHYGNLLLSGGYSEDALRAYQKALNLQPNNIEYLKNCASVFIELDMVLRAEEILHHLLEISPTADSYNLVANLARIKGEFKRAELALLDITLLNHLTSLYIDMSDYEKAKKASQNTISFFPDNKKALNLKNKIQKLFEEKITCSTCKRKWWVPYNLSEQPPFKIRGEPPGECPAGQCPECKKIFCVKCASQYLRGDRFICPQCNINLKLNDNRLRYLVLSYITNESS